jgi:hypothetical protein
MADINQAISDFYNVAQERDFARDFQYRIINIRSDNFAITEEDLVYAKGGEVPARTIQNHTAPYMGLDFNVPGAPSYSGTFSLNFYCDNASTIRRLFEEWSFNTFDEETSGGDYFVPKPTSVLDMVQVDPQFRPVARYQLVGVYPQEVGAMTYDITGAGAPIEMAVTLQYHFWRRKSPLGLAS